MLVALYLIQWSMQDASVHFQLHDAPDRWAFLNDVLTHHLLTGDGSGDYTHSASLSLLNMTPSSIWWFPGIGVNVVDRYLASNARI